MQSNGTPACLAVGMALDLHAIVARPLFVIGLAAAVVGVKTLLIFGLALLFGVARRQAFALGLLLSQGGEFGFVVFQTAATGGVISAQLSSFLVAAVTVSMILTPLMLLTRIPLPGFQDFILRRLLQPVIQIQICIGTQHAAASPQAAASSRSSTRPRLHCHA